MAVTILQAGANLQMMDTDGVLTTLTLPTGVTLRTDVAPRWAVYGRYAVLVNTPSQPLTIDASGTVRLLTPRPPRQAPVLSGVGVSTLSGAYRAKMTFVILDALGNVISESDYSPFSAQVTITSNFLQAASLDLSPDTISGRRIYRTTTGGAVYFQWVDVDGNIVTSVQDDLSDAGLSIVGAPILGTPPRLTTVAEFRGRLFGVGDIDIDHVRYTEAGFAYAWPEDNLIEVPGVGSDEFGAVALIPRREALGVGRRNMLAQIVGTGAEDADGNPDFDMVILSKELGVESQESVQVYRDVAYFLWKDGVYAWDSGGIRCVSNGTEEGRGQVRAWFTTDTYFNRDLFSTAFAHMVPDQPTYRLFLASAGSTVIDSWVEYDIDSQTWWGPHSTELFDPTSAFKRVDAANREVPVVGGATAVYEEQATRTDGTATAISMDVIGKRHDLQEPDLDKYFGEITLLGKVQTAGSMAVVTRTGELNQTLAKTQYFDMRKNRQRLGRLGVGKHAQVRLQNAEVGVDAEIYGYEIDPVTPVGRR